MLRTFALFGLVLAAGAVAFVGVSSVLTQSQADGSAVIDLVLAPVGRTSLTGHDRPVEFWPPVAGQKYPDLVLRDSEGQLVRLSDHAGKVILVELVAIPCKGCQAFAGGKRYGGFAGVGVQSGLNSIHDYAREYASIDLKSTDNVLFVQLLLYGKGMGAPTMAETRGWAEHFRANDVDHQMVLRGDSSMVNRITYNMIPGFHLIDRDFVLRSDSCGHSPNDNLYTELLPKLGQLANRPMPSISSDSKVNVNPFFQG